MCIFLTIMKIYLQMEFGNSSLPKNQLPLTREEKKVWLHKLHGVSLGSDAFFPFGDNIERAHRSGVDYIAQAGGSIRDDNVIETCDKYNIARHLLVYVCSIIKDFPPKKTLADFFDKND